MKLRALATAALGLALAMPALAAFERTPNGLAGAPANPAPPAQPAPEGGPLPIELIVDGGFEACVPSAAPDACPDWGEFSSNFGSPICDAGWCGTGGGTAGPNGGSVWSWFGGAAGAELGWVEQAVVIPAGGTATLSFYFWTGVWGGGATDEFQVVIDGGTVPFWLLGSQLDQPPYNTGYSQVVLDLTSWADGGVHTIRFSAIEEAGLITNMNLDDVSLLWVANLEPTVAIPTLDAWGLTAIAAALAAAAFVALRRRRRAV